MFEHSSRWHGKLLSLGIPPEVIAAANIEEQDYQVLFARLKDPMLFIKPQLRITAAWQLEILANKPQQLADIMQKRDNLGSNPAHYFAWTGQTDALRAVKTHYPQLLQSINTVGNNLAHFAAWSGSIATLEWVSRQDKNMLFTHNHYGMNIAHYACWSGSGELFLWIGRETMLYSLEFIDLFSVVDSDHCHIAHYAAWSGNLTLLKDAKKYLGHMGDHFKFGNLALYAAMSGKQSVLDWVRRYDKEQLKIKDSDARNILVLAAMAGSLSLVRYLVSRYPGLVHETNDKGRHVIFYCRDFEILEWLQGNYPNIFYVKDKEGKDLYDVAFTTFPQDIFKQIKALVPEKRQLMLSRVNSDTRPYL